MGMKITGNGYSALQCFIERYLFPPTHTKKPTKLIISAFIQLLSERLSKTLNRASRYKPTALTLCKQSHTFHTQLWKLP